MANIIYLVLDGDNETVGPAHRTFEGGREAFLDHIDKMLMGFGETWEEYAEKNNFGSVEQFKNAMRMYCDWDCDFEDFARFQDIPLEE